MPRSRQTLRIVLSAAMAVVSFLGLSTARPCCAQAPRPEDRDAKAPLARFVPARSLGLYAEFQGLDAHAEAWRKSAAHGLLNETKLGGLLEDLVAQGIEQFLKQRDRAGMSGAEVVGSLERIARSGFVIASHGTIPKQARIILVVRNGADPEVRRLLDRLVDALSGPKPERKVIHRGGRSIVMVGEAEKGGAIWDDRGDTVLCDAEGIDTVLSVLDGKEPSATDHPIRVELAKSEPRFRPVGIAFVDMSVLPAPPPDAVQLGVDGIRRIDFRWGFQDEALMSILRVVAPEPRRGALALLDQPTFDTSSLPPLPKGLTGFTVASIDPAKSYDRVVALRKATEPDGEKKVAANERSRREALGLDLRTDLLPHLGPKLALYSLPKENAAGGFALPLLDLAITIQTSDANAVGKALEPLMKALNVRLSARGPNDPRPPGSPTPEFLKVDGSRTTYVLSMPPGQLPPGPLATLQPTMIVGGDQVIIAARRAGAEAVLAQSARKDDRWTPTGAFAAMAQQLPSNLIFLNVSDPRETFPALIAALPAIANQFNMAMMQAQAQAKREGPGGFSLRVDPNMIPPSDDLVRRLFPSSIAVAVDREGMRVVTREALPTITSPASSGVAIALLLPAVQAAREAARRSQCVNNLKQIGLALHSYHAVEAGFPKAAITDPQGKPLLSWRVALLPYLEQQSLFEKFKLDEPWDSPHNRPLLDLMPAVYACPSVPRPEPGMTSYRAFADHGALLETTRTVKRAEITDGLAFTLAVVEAKEAVPWTKPDELTLSDEPAPPLLGAGSFHAGGFNALSADGSVRFIKLSIKPKTLRALITRAGNDDARDDQP